MPFISRQESFDCENCEWHAKPLEHGTCRNHCPHCLCSKHVDEEGPGDRASKCLGLMIPVNMEKKGGETILVHQCERCGKIMRNKTAPDDNIDSMIDISVARIS